MWETGKSQETETESEQAERNHPRLPSRLRKVQQGHWEVPGSKWARGAHLNQEEATLVTLLPSIIGGEQPMGGEATAQSETNSELTSQALGQ